MNRDSINVYAINFTNTLQEWVKTTLFPEFTMQVKLDWNSSRRSSRGGWYAKGPGINMAMVHCYPLSTPYRFYEYPSYDNDPIIGGFYSKNPIDKLKAVLAHETAHAIQFYWYKQSGTRDKPHGEVFKNYYKMLRTNFVNDNICYDDTTKAAYDALYKHVSASSKLTVKQLEQLLRSQ